ncbi:hypothetical protein QMK32_12690 [Rhodococcus sp. H29-C3]|nr:hypothetical protein [Rhodococcus sp. H29-C3]
MTAAFPGEGNDAKDASSPKPRVCAATCQRSRHHPHLPGPAQPLLHPAAIRAAGAVGLSTHLRGARLGAEFLAINVGDLAGLRQRRQTRRASAVTTGQAGHRAAQVRTPPTTVVLHRWRGAPRRSSSPLSEPMQVF